MEEIKEININENKNMGEDYTSPKENNIIYPNTIRGDILTSGNIMTVFYSIRTGRIDSVFSGKQDMSIFGDRLVDMEQILDYIWIPFDGLIVREFYKFYVDVNGEYDIKIYPSCLPQQPDYSKYR